jgi:hypothetical protein
MFYRCGACSNPFGINQEETAMNFVNALAAAGLMLSLSVATAADVAALPLGGKTLRSAPGPLEVKLVCPPGSGKQECGYDVDPYTGKKTRTCYCGHGRRPISR